MEDDEEQEQVKIRIPKHKILHNDLEGLKKENELLNNNEGRNDRFESYVSPTIIQGPAKREDPKVLLERILECNFWFYLI